MTFAVVIRPLHFFGLMTDVSREVHLWTSSNTTPTKVEDTGGFPIFSTLIIRLRFWTRSSLIRLRGKQSPGRRWGGRLSWRSRKLFRLCLKQSWGCFWLGSYRILMRGYCQGYCQYTVTLQTITGPDSALKISAQETQDFCKFSPAGCCARFFWILQPLSGSAASGWKRRFNGKVGMDLHLLKLKCKASVKYNMTTLIIF